MNRTILLSLALAGAFFFSAQLSSAQVVIYKLNFEKEGSSINYSFYEEGWVVADATGGPAQWILTFFEGPVRRYITVTDFGSLSYASKGNTVKAVISAAAADGTPQTTFLAIGTPADTIRFENLRIRVAKTLEGTTSSADDESELPFSIQEGNKGFAGFSKMMADLQRNRTDSANSKKQTVEEAFADLITYLERRGYTPFVVEDPADPEEGDGEGDAP